jgi:hypothetical protein
MKKMHPHHEAYMKGHKDGKAGRPAMPPDPERKAGDGMAMAEGKKRDAGTEKGRASKAPDPQKGKGDGMKTAMRGEGRSSKLSPMGGAREMVR